MTARYHVRIGSANSSRWRPKWRKQCVRSNRKIGMKSTVKRARTQRRGCGLVAVFQLSLWNVPVEFYQGGHSPHSFLWMPAAGGANIFGQTGAASTFCVRNGEGSERLGGFGERRRSGRFFEDFFAGCWFLRAPRETFLFVKSAAKGIFCGDREGPAIMRTFFVGVTSLREHTLSLPSN